jgi:hypothetical protein
MSSERRSDGSEWKGPVQYASTRDGSVAYRLLTGDADSPHHLVLLLSGTASMEALFADPIGSRLLYGLAKMGRVAVFDRRGTLSGNANSTVMTASRPRASTNTAVP